MGLHPELERAEWVVFHGAVSEAVPALSEVVQSGLEGRSLVYARWLQGVALGACGRYGEALDVVEQIPPGTPEYSMARSLRGSLLRQLGVHDLALIADREAMSSAATPGAAIEALTGLSADAIGLQDALTARTMLGQAGSLLERMTADQASMPTWWRHRVRLDWVRCEADLLNGDPHAAREHAGAALAAAEAAAAPRHVAKSLLFVGVAEIESGERVQAVTTLRRCLMLTTTMGFQAVGWPAHAVLAALLKQEDPQAAHEHFLQASAITTALRAGLAGTLAARWDARADIRALHREAS